MHVTDSRACYRTYTSSESTITRTYRCFWAIFDFHDKRRSLKGCCSCISNTYHQSRQQSTNYPLANAFVRHHIPHLIREKKIHKQHHSPYLWCYKSLNQTTETRAKSNELRDSTMRQRPTRERCIEFPIKGRRK